MKTTIIRRSAAKEPAPTRLVGQDGWPLVVGAEAVLYRRDGQRLKGAAGHVKIEALNPPTERYPGGTVEYRVLEKTSCGVVPAERVRLVKRTDRSLRDEVNTHGVPPSRGRVATPKRRT